jgi:hypothetical protein
MSLKTTLMAGPLGALSAGRAASTTQFEMTSMAAPLGALPTGPAASATEFEDDVDGGAP